MGDQAPVRQWKIRSGDHAAARKARLEFREHLRVAFREQSKVHADAEIVFGELVSNAVRHARKEVRIQVLRGAGTALRVIDDGDCFPPELINRHPHEEESGRGLLIATLLTRQLRIERNSAGCVVTAVLALG